MKQIFVSYSRNDVWLIDRIVEDLSKAGFDVWIDRGGIHGGDQWRLQIVEAILESDIFLILLSPYSVESENVRKELDIADSERKLILPLLFPGARIPSTMQYQLAGTQFVELLSQFNKESGRPDADWKYRLAKTHIDDLPEIKKDIAGIIDVIKQMKFVPVQKTLKQEILPNGTVYHNRFKIRGFIGRGGFSSAYVAWDRVKDCEIVLKIFTELEKRPRFLRRFAEREAKLARKLTNRIDGLVSTLEVISTSDELCLVQEYVPGQSLHNRLDDTGILGLKEAVKTIVNVGNTLVHLHELGIYHCDIKPLNIIIKAAGIPTVIDLGAARFSDEEILIDDILLTIPYSPAELFTGNPINGSVDVYSLGMTLLHTITGLPNTDNPNETMPRPFVDLDSIPTEKEITDYIDERFREINSVELKMVLRIALAYHPENRYSTMKEFVQNLIRVEESLD